MIISLENKNAFVCGSSQGIGKAIALQMAKAGANVTITARNVDKLKKTLLELDTSRGQHDYVVADFSLPGEAMESIKQHTAGKAFQILVNNSGGPAPGLAHEDDPDKYISAFKQHIVMNQNLLKHFLPGMKEANFGRIINVISISVKEPVENLGVSNTIRGAVNSWSKTISRELGPFGITVNNLLPGHTKTERLDNLMNNKAQASEKSFEQVQSEMQARIPAGRFVKPEELGYAAVFFASEYASMISGQNLAIDGAYLRSL